MHIHKNTPQKTPVFPTLFYPNTSYKDTLYSGYHQTEKTSILLHNQQFAKSRKPFRKTPGFNIARKIIGHYPQTYYLCDIKRKKNYSPKSMKTKHIIGCLMLAGACLSCSSDKEDDVLIITDKGPDIDDDKTLQTPGEQKPVKPGDIGDPSISPDTIQTPFPSDTIPDIGGEDEPTPPALNTLYITDFQTDTVLFAGDSETINSHIIIKENGSLNVHKDHTMHNDATITIESGGYMSVGGCLKQVDLTIKPGGTLNIWSFSGAIFLKSKESLHIEPKAIIKCNGQGMYNDGLTIYFPSTDPLSPAIEKLDSTDVQPFLH